jgi:hypothetical protein
MNKTMEYMAYCMPSVAFDLLETRISAADRALYVSSGDSRALRMPSSDSLMTTTCAFPWAWRPVLASERAP